MSAMRVLTAALATTLGLSSFALAAEPTAPSQDAAAEAQKRDQHLSRYFADVLMLANHSEIQLSQLAQRRSTNQEIQQLAETIAEDHSRLNAAIDRVVPGTRKRFEAANRERQPGQQARHRLLTRLCMINHQAAENHLERSEKMLENYQGQDFDMAFLGLQIANHNWLIAELQAIDDVGSSEFQDLLQETTQTVEHHLEKAVALSRKLEDDRRTARSR
ncbi:MAG: DUF4142 domain-containing protein [Planctomycetota bacterium]|nr:MAG: DUF4142 domain-containing protein [Planctomycetota bacterium]